MGESRVISSRFPAQLALGLGSLLTLGYFGWLLTQRYDASEFAYAPFGPEPLPYSPMRGFTYEQLWGHVARLVLLAPGLLLASFGLARLRPLTFQTTTRRLLVVAVTLGLGMTAAVMLGVLRGRPIADDELVYRMQASFYSEGRLTGLDVGFTPPDYFSVATRLGYTGKYLPGEGFVQVLGVLVGVPALMHLPLLALTLYAWHRQLTLRESARFADLATIALALSPMVIMTAASGLSETTSLCSVALAGLGLEWARGDRTRAGAALCALAVTFGIATRPQSLVPAGLVLVPWLAVALWRRRAWAALGLFALLLAAGASAVCLYNMALSGSPLKLPWYLLCTIENYGFGRVWKYDQFEHTPWTALENLGVVLVRLNAWWLGFPCSLVVLALAGWLKVPLGRFRAWWGVAAAIVAFEAAYYSPGASDTGSVYHHELVLPGSLVVALVATAAFERSRALATTALGLHFVFGTLAFLGEQTARLTRLAAAIHSDSDAALARIQTPALLFHELRGSEMRITGWIFDSFPRRYRGARDAIVTFPNLPEKHRAGVARAYPGRACYYYHRDPRTEAAQLLRCEQATALMDRPFGMDEERPIWIPPTAYKVTSYDPFESNRRRRVYNAKGQPFLTCCGLREFEALGGTVQPKVMAQCVEDNQ